MKRLTSDNIFEMNMHQLALNQVYIGEGGWTQYVEGSDCECSVCDLVRAVSETLGVELPILSDEALSNLVLDWLRYGVEEPEGVVAILYRALCAMAEVRDRLFRYEDTGLEPEDVDALQNREQGLAELLVSVSCGCTVSYTRLAELARAEKGGRLVALPCKVGDTVWTNTAIVGDRYKSADRPYLVKVVFAGMGEHSGFLHIQYSNGRTFPIDFDKVGKTVFLTYEEAEAALKKEGGGRQ